MQKDNFTDVVENLPQAPESNNSNNTPQEPVQQQVISSNGETITLSQK